MHAVVLLAHFHSLASFIYGCGINAEIDHEDGHTFHPLSVPDSNSTDDGQGSHPNSHSTTPNSVSNTSIVYIGLHPSITV